VLNLASAQKSKKPYYYLGKNPDLDFLRSLILLIDGYLTYFFDDPDPYDRWIRRGALGREFLSEWREVYKTLYKIAGSIKRIPGLKGYVMIQGMLRAFSIPITLTAALLPIAGAVWGRFLEFMILSFIMAFVGALALIFSWIAGKKFAEGIDQYFKTHKEKFKFKRSYLRDVVQRLIYSLAYYLKKRGEDLSEYKFKLFNSFYDGIIVLKKPKWFRKKYLVKFNAKKLPF